MTVPLKVLFDRTNGTHDYQHVMTRFLNKAIYPTLLSPRGNTGNISGFKWMASKMIQILSENVSRLPGGVIFVCSILYCILYPCVHSCTYWQKLAELNLLIGFIFTMANTPFHGTFHVEHKLWVTHLSRCFSFYLRLREKRMKRCQIDYFIIFIIFIQ